MANKDEFEYAGFWIRVLASIIDTILILIITMPLLLSFYGTRYFDSDKIIQGQIDFFVSWIFPAIAVILFWTYKLATPGKMAISSIIVNSHTGEKPSLGQFVGRYFAYFLSGIPLGLEINLDSVR